MTQPTTAPLMSSTRPVRAELARLVRGLQPGQRIRVTQNLRVGSTDGQLLTFPLVLLAIC